MAYPNRIATSGQIRLTNDILEYFKKSHEAYVNDIDYSEIYPDYWRGLVDQLVSGGIPSTLSAFQSILSSHLPENIYTYSEPVSGWSRNQVNDWGKVKSIQMALYGTGSTRLSKFNSQPYPSVNLWTDASLAYLRYALTLFSTYGTCVVDIKQQPAPTAPVENVPARTFNWTYASGKTSPSNYEYSINGGNWITATTKPINVPNTEFVGVGGVELRTKAVGYIEASNIITNDVDYTLEDANLTISASYNALLNYLGATVSIAAGKTLPNNLTVTFLINFREGGVQQPARQYTAVINAGNSSGSGGGEYIPSQGQSITQVTGKIVNAIPNPNGSYTIKWS